LGIYNGDDVVFDNINHCETSPNREEIMIYEWILNLWVLATSLGILVLSLVFLPGAIDEFYRWKNDRK